jgi:hypothetical protein
MSKVTKKVWLILIIVALALPMFVGCKPEPEVPDYKAEFLGVLKNETGKIDSSVAVVTITGENIAVELKSTVKATVEEEAQILVNTLKTKTGTGTTLTIAGKDYTLDSDLTVLGKAVKDGLSAGKISYTAKVIYSGQTVNLSGTITFTGLGE